MFAEIRALKRPQQLVEVIFKTLVVELNGADWSNCVWQDIQKELADPRSVLAAMRKHTDFLTVDFSKFQRVEELLRAIRGSI